MIDTVFFQPFLSGFDQYAAVSAFLFFSDNTDTLDFSCLFRRKCDAAAGYRLVIFCQQNRLQIIFALVLSEFQFNRNVLSAAERIGSDVIICFVFPLFASLFYPVIFCLVFRSF